ncbi:MAG: SDR family NAD(P)-dependent oxidoreductase, partial [Betaproteobacteria bacterium]
MNTIDLNGRCAVITGGASGIGAEIARRLSASGARIALWDLDQRAAAQLAAALPAIGGSHLALATDVTDEASVQRACDATIAGFGRIDILVCSAGNTGPNATTCHNEPASWRQVM